MLLPPQNYQLICDRHRRSPWGRACHPARAWFWAFLQLVSVKPARKISLLFATAGYIIMHPDSNNRTTFRPRHGRTRALQFAAGSLAGFCIYAFCSPTAFRSGMKEFGLHTFNGNK
ncbi:hypothetical protein KL928_004865 [Ogataea angusta]|uniref:Uncharacterized protein n=1 Tax=Pichia angusta TaxID=870730 RepID=A0AAN6I3V3_PICAN|nr:uncharacterized protein KL928_004865 [Ogataea angusta]KAG7816309.1 hypothetical protein KL928_004865 [Ogataea angusta]